jgi:hypothetical protein
MAITSVSTTVIQELDVRFEVLINVSKLQSVTPTQSGTQVPMFQRSILPPSSGQTSELHGVTGTVNGKVGLEPKSHYII